MPRVLTKRHEVVYVLVLLLTALGVYLPGLTRHAIWYDEAITLLQTAGHASPPWPQTPTPARVAKQQFAGAPPLSAIAATLRHRDVHPPLYYWSLSLWRQWAGFSLEAARAFSLLWVLTTLVTLYLLLRAGGIEYPLVPVAVYAMSTGAVYIAQEARPYALALFLTMNGALFAYLASACYERRAAAMYALVMAVCCGAAFHTNYLTLFPVGVILLWFLVQLWSLSPGVAVMAPLVAVGLGGVGVPTLLQQLGTRPDQYAGFVGFTEEIQTIRKMTLYLLWKPTFLGERLGWWIYKGPTVLLGSLIGITFLHLFFHWRESNRKLWLLLLGLAVAPSLGVVFLDCFFNKHLHQPSYLVFAGPALAAVVTYGGTKLISARRWWAIVPLAILLGVQLASINWDSPKGLMGHSGLDMRSSAGIIRASSSPSHIVVIGAGDENESGHPGAAVYELEPQTMIVILRPTSDLDGLLADVQNYEDVWLIQAVDHATAEVEDGFADRLRESGRYREVFRKWPVIHFCRGELLSG
jgi:hypothetical protein